MTRMEAQKIIDRLKNGCTFHRFDESGFTEEYYKFLMRNNYKPMNESVDIALEEDSRNVPPISILAKAYKKVLNDGPVKASIVNTEYCEVCDDKGFVMITEVRRLENAKIKADIPYESFTYCPFCPVGQLNAYDGSKCKEKTEYSISPLTKYLDEFMVNQLRSDNRALQRHRKSGKKMTLNEIKQLIVGFGKIGWKMPEISDADDSDFDDKKYFDSEGNELDF